jgi:hypothetical protein
MASTKVVLSFMGNLRYNGLHSTLYLLAKLENMSVFVVCVGYHAVYRNCVFVLAL